MFSDFAAFTSWRSSIPPFHSPRFPLKIPETRSRFEVAALLGPPAYLCESTLYLVQPVNTFPTSTSSSSSSSSCNKGWLIKVEESNSGKLRLLDALPNLKYISSPLNPTDLDLLNFRVVELRKAYTLGFQVGIIPNSYRPIPWVNKVVMFPSSDGPAAFVVFNDGKLGFAKCGDEKWTLVNDGSSEYDDIIVYKGQLYVVDTLGIVWWVKCSSLELVPFSPPLCGLGDQKHLVESCGALYVVDRYLDRERPTMENYVRLRTFPNAVDFKVYKLDEEEGSGWVLLKSLGDRAFVLGTDCCFSVSAQEFVGCKGNCIYFIDLHEIHVFSLEDQSIGDLAYSEAPTWLSSANPLPLMLV